MKSIAAFLCLVAFALPAAAQDAQPPPVDPDTLKNLPVPKWARAALASFSKPLHPVIGGVATNGGVGAGIGYNSPDEQRAFTTGKAMFTLRRFWSFEGEIGRRSLSRRSQIGAFAVVRDMGRLDYFGIGPGTDLDNRAAFGLREMTWGARGWFRLAPALRLGTSISAYKPDLRRTNSSSLRPIEAVFADESVPGLASDPLFGRYRAFIE